MDHRPVAGGAEAVFEGVSGAGAGAVDAVLVPAWPATPATYASIGDARRLAPQAVSVGAYVTVLPPAYSGTVLAHARAVLAAGADELHLYHLGLANRSQLDRLGELAETAPRPASGSGHPLTERHEAELSANQPVQRLCRVGRPELRNQLVRERL